MVVTLRNIGMGGGALTVNDGSNTAQTRIGKRYRGGHAGQDSVLAYGLNGIHDYNPEYAFLNHAKQFRTPRIDNFHRQVDFENLTTGFTVGNTLSDGTATAQILTYVTFLRVHFTNGQRATTWETIDAGHLIEAGTSGRKMIARSGGVIPSGDLTAGTAVGYVDISTRFDTGEAFTASETLTFEEGRVTATYSSVETAGYFLVGPVTNGPFTGALTELESSAAADFVSQGNLDERNYDDLVDDASVDANGYINTWASVWDGYVLTIYVNYGKGNGLTRQGTFEFTWTGDDVITLNSTGGVITEDVGSGPNKIIFTVPDSWSGNIWFQISKWTTTYPHDFVCVKQGLNKTLFDAGEIFDPVWLGMLDDGNGVPCRDLRFMDWMKTNGQYLDDWADYPQNADYFTYTNKVPIPVMVALMNKKGVDGRFCIPGMAGMSGAPSGQTDFATQLATYLKANVHADLVSKIEYSNEAWNSNFQINKTQLKWEAASVLGWANPTNSGVIGSVYAKNSVAQSDAIKVVYGDEAPARFSWVCGGHLNGGSGASSWNGNALNGTSWNAETGGSVQPSDSYDEYAVTCYFGSPYVQSSTLCNALVARVDAGDTEAQLNAFIKGQIDTEGYVTTDLASQLSTQETLAGTVNLPLTLYEGGTHVLHSAYAVSGGDRTKVINALIDFSDSAEMGQLYQEAFDLVKLHCDGPFMQFVEQSGRDEYGAWGSRNTADDTNPRHAAMMARVEANAPWFSDIAGRDLGTPGPVSAYSMDSNVGSLVLVLTDNGNGTHNANVTGTPAYYVGNYTIQTADLAAGKPIIVVQPGGAVESPAGTWTVNAGLVIYPTGSTLESTTRWYRADDDAGTNEAWTGDSDQVYTITSPADDNKRVYYREYHVVTESGLDVTSSEVEVQEETDFLAETKTAVNGAGDGFIILMDTGTWQDTSATTAAGNGDSIARIDDQSNHSNNMLQSNSTNQPTLTVSGGLTYIDADGINDYLEAAFTHTGAALYFAYASDNSIGDNNECLIGFGKNGWVVWSNDNFVAGHRQTTSGRKSGTTRNNQVAVGAHTGISVVEGWSDGSEVGACIDGGTDVTTAYTPGSNYDTQIARMLAMPNLGGYYTGKVYGLICMTSIPTSGERASIRGLLAQKSGATLS